MWKSQTVFGWFQMHAFVYIVRIIYTKWLRCKFIAWVVNVNSSFVQMEKSTAKTTLHGFMEIKPHLFSPQFKFCVLRLILFLLWLLSNAKLHAAATKKLRNSIWFSVYRMNERTCMGGIFNTNTQKMSYSACKTWMRMCITLIVPI